jgi:hypothetical protein
MVGKDDMANLMDVVSLSARDRLIKCRGPHPSVTYSIKARTGIAPIPGRRRPRRCGRPGPCAQDLGEGETSRYGREVSPLCPDPA